MNWLQITWFWLVLFLLTVYAILDGFDLGAGFWYLFARTEDEKRKILNAIGPFWDGNEVWLLTGGGAIFAAFPNVYATVFSGFYIPLMLLLFALMFRAVAIEFRNKHESYPWKKFWDISFVLGSIIPAILFGVAIGNILRGIPLTDSLEFNGTFLSLLNPYSILMGLLSLAMFATQGGLFLKSEQTKALARHSTAIYLILFLEVMLTTHLWKPGLFNNFISSPILWVLPVISVLAIIIAFIKRSFLASSISIFSNMAMVGFALFPNIVPSSNNPYLALNIVNASSSYLTLKAMFIIALIGMPFVVGYTVWIYSTFKKTSTVEY